MILKIGLMEVQRDLVFAQVMNISMDSIISTKFQCSTQQCTNWMFKTNAGHGGLGCDVSLKKFIEACYLAICR